MASNGKRLSLLVKSHEQASPLPALVRETLKLTTWRCVEESRQSMVGIPYLKRKLDESYDINAPRALLGGNYTRMPANPTWKQRFIHYYRWFLRNVYPSVNAAYYFSLLAFNVAYLFDNSKYHSPLMWLIWDPDEEIGRGRLQSDRRIECTV